jgi:AcrR family transcriptional regulator
MEGLTIQEIAEKLGLSTAAVYTRLRTAEIKPKTHAGKTLIFDESVIDRIREVSKGGRPRKAPPKG